MVETIPRNQLSTHCALGYSEYSLVTPFTQNCRMFPSFPCKTEKPLEGTPEVPEEKMMLTINYSISNNCFNILMTFDNQDSPVTNCKRRARVS